MKIKCKKCDNMAVWQYMPSDSVRFYCEECIDRGCSCNMREDGYMSLDYLNRNLPCVEYDYNESGFDE